MTISNIYIHVHYRATWVRIVFVLEYWVYTLEIKIIIIIIVVYIDDSKIIIQ